MSTARIGNGDTLLDRRKISIVNGFDEYKVRINETRRKIGLLTDKLEPFKEGHPDAISTDEETIWWALNWMQENIGIWQTTHREVDYWVGSKRYPNETKLMVCDERVLGTEKATAHFIVMPSDEGVIWLNEVYRWCYGIEERDSEGDDGLSEFSWENA